MNVNDRDREGRTPLHYAVIDAPVGLDHTAALDDPALKAENHSAIVEFIRANSQRLLEAGADVNASDDAGSTPLHFAAKGESHEAVRLLLDAGADANARNDKGETPLYNAVRNTTPAALNIMRLLHESGADPTIETAKGGSALRFVRRYGKPEEKELFADLL
ncbi:ankyrin repeat domain-containing protein [Mycobacterium sp.]|uniref:ankyrin repeat domain-containing protein n=1 Tax=Mycobacterium sp. TaxID=1785 RepID=UPI003BAB3E38